MSAVEPLYKLVGRQVKSLSKEEINILEIELFFYVCQELNEYFRLDSKKYFDLMKFGRKVEDEMLESSFIRNIIRDVVSTGEYSLAGIAHSTNIPEDVIVEIALGKNDNPSLHASRKLVELHKGIRVDLYKNILNRILVNNEYSE